jgi:hypothetical protein
MGSPKAMTATAHQIAKIVYNLLKPGTAYVDRGVQSYEDQYRHRVVKNLHRRADQLGFTLQPKALSRSVTPAKLISGAGSSGSRTSEVCPDSNPH